MKKKAQQLTDTDLKKMVFKRLPSINFIDSAESVTIVREQNHWIQRFLRKLSFKIPEKTYLELDDYGSFVFRLLDGQHSVYEIGQLLGAKYDEANDFLYNRLLLYLHHLEENEKLIEKVN